MNKIKTSSTKENPVDQMKTIIDKLGALSDEDKSFITSEDAKKYVSMLKSDPEVREKYE